MEIFGTKILTADIIGNGQIAVFIIAKTEVDAFDFTRFVLSDEKLRAARRKASGCMVLGFDYDDDSREVYEIPEVVAYAKEVFRICPHLLYYIPADYAILAPIAFCAMDATMLSKVSGNARVGFKDTKRARETLNKLIGDASSYSLSLGDKKTPLRMRAAFSGTGLLQ